MVRHKSHKLSNWLFWPQMCSGVGSCCASIVKSFNDNNVKNLDHIAAAIVEAMEDCSGYGESFFWIMAIHWDRN